MTTGRHAQWTPHALSGFLLAWIAQPPKYAKYQGGDAESAASFACVAP
jgi:hypothetical protein